MKTIIALIGILIMSTTASLRAATAADSIIGDWFAQIDIPQNELTILMEINIADSENCTVKCTWSGGFPTEEESGKAKYRFDGKQLTVTFLNEEERIAPTISSDLKTSMTSVSLPTALSFSKTGSSAVSMSTSAVAIRTAASPR